MKEYTEGGVVRITATFSFNVDETVYFEFDDTLAQFGNIGDKHTIIISPSNPRQCYIDIDTFGIVGDHQYHIYSRGPIKAAAKGFFRVS